VAARAAMVDPTVSGCTTPAAKVATSTPFLRRASLTLCVTRTTTANRTTLRIDASYPFVSVLVLFVLPSNRLTETTTVVFNNP
jgi:hypothetical protein